MADNYNQQGTGVSLGKTAAFSATGLFLFAVAALFAHPQQPRSSRPSTLFHVTVSPSLPGPVSGRLLLFMKQGSGDSSVDSQEFQPEATWIAAQEVHDLKPGDSVELDANNLAYPKPFRDAPTGTWEAQAVLDTTHSYNYSGRGPGDWESGVIALHGGEPTMLLDRHPEPSPREAKAAEQSGTPGVAELFTFQSPALTRFWGRPTSIRAWVILPPGYDPKADTRYPVMYWTHGFGGNLAYSLASGMSFRGRMGAGKTPPMIGVFLDESCPQGTHEFADSVNNGPWGTALTTEFIPAVEAKYRMDAKPSGRLLNGHSSGGWATLQLEINYPQVFGGTWSTSPDPSDFHDFTGTDLYAPHANVYRKTDGSAPTPIMRANGKVVATFEQFARMEEVLGPYGGQVSSFEWVFSPRGASGAPVPMFDRVTGAVHPEVVRYWHDHYDLAHLAEQHWPENGTLLKGRVHVFVGTADTFYLDGSAHLLDARLAKLGADARFTYIPGRTHFDLYRTAGDPQGLYDQIAREMYAVARPGVGWR